MRFGYVVPNNNGIADPSELIELALQAEELGFDSVWVSHHVLNVGYIHDRLGNKPYHDALVTLTWIAARTTRIKLGTSVLVMPYLHPMVLAKELATLDHLCGGRLIVGLGVGSLPEENAAFCLPYESRGKYGNEFIGVLRALWTQDAARFGGEYFNFEGLITSPKPLQQPHPPIVIGGNRPVALRRVARLGDGWHPMNLPPHSVRKRLPLIREEEVKAGRPPMSTVQRRIGMERITAEAVADYADAGVTELVMSLDSGTLAERRTALERFKSNVMTA